MTAVGFAPGILLFLLLAAGGTDRDLASWIRAEDYFKSRKVDVSVETMAKLVGEKPTNGKEAISQVLAIRWLGDHVSKDAKVRELLQKVADGKVGQDDLGFAQDYARRALAHLDGKPLAAPEVPADSLADGVSWFPARSMVVEGIDLRRGVVDAESGAKIRALAMKEMPAEAREPFYDFADAVGNIRIDRVTGGLGVGEGSDIGEYFIRVTGRVNRERLTNEILKQLKGTTATGGDNSTRISGGPGLSLDIVGDTDIVLVGLKNGGDDERKKLLDEIRAIRAGKKAGVAKSERKLLEGMPARAIGAIAADLDPKVHAELLPGPAAIFPPKFLFSIVQGKTLEANLNGTTSTEADAKALAEQLTELKKQGGALFMKVADQMKLKEESRAQAIKSIDGVVIKAEGKKITVSAQVPAELLGIVFLGFIDTVRADSALPRP